MKPLHQYREIYNPYSNNVDWEQPSLYEEPDITKNVNPVDRELADIEAEEGEIILKPDMSGIYEIKGKKHSKGGTPIQAEANSFIYSDYKNLAISKEMQELLKLKKGGPTGKQKNTPAEVLKRNLDIKHYNKMINNLDDVNKDVIAKRSSELMLGKYQEILGRVAYAQEEQKDFEQGVPEFVSNTAPVMDAELQEKIDEQEQYLGGGRVNPYLPKAQIGLWYGNRLSNQRPVNAVSGANGSKSVVVNSNYGVLPGNPNQRWGYHPGDNYDLFQRTNNTSLSNAADKLGDNWEQLVTDLDYTGPKNNLAFQHWLYNQSKENAEIIDRYHRVYDEGPIGGKFDGNIGIRWARAIDEIRNRPRKGTTKITSPTPEESRTPLTPNETINPTLPYDPQVRRTPEMIADEAWLGLQATQVKRYNPYRKQIKSALVDFGTYDSQNVVNRLNTAANQAYRATRGLNPYQAQATIMEVYGKTLNSIADVEGQYDEKNVGQETLKNQSNNQIQRADLQANIGFDGQYYDQSVLSNQRFDNAKTIAWNQFRTLRNQNQEQLDELYNVLAQQPIAGSVPVLDENGNQVLRDGKPLYQSKPLYDVVPGTIRTRLTGAGNIFNQSAGNSTFDLESQYNQLMQKAISGTLTKEQAIALSAAGRLLGASKRNRATSIYNPYNN